jgi:uncharacterized repeat protein (TIGR01451 family)
MLETIASLFHQTDLAPTRRRPHSRSRRLRFESLEGRRVFTAAPEALIHGTVYNDATGGGQPSDGPGLANVTVDLWKDGGDGLFEGSGAGTDDTLIGSTTTDSAGGYTFSGLGAGAYFVQEVSAPTGYALSSSNPQEVTISSSQAQGSVGQTIDNFQTSQLVDANSTGSTTAASTIAASDALGGYQNLFVHLTSTFGDVNLNSDAFNQGVLEFNSSATGTGTRYIAWDGNNSATPAVLNYTGLGGVDLTSGGNDTGLELQIGTDHDNTTVTLLVYTDAGDWSSAVVDVPNTGGADTSSVFVPYSSFSNGAGNGANFADVGAMVMQITGNQAANGQISTIGAVGPTELTANFANYQPASVGTTLFWDANSNGLDNSGEPGVPNATVQLMQAGSVVATTTTNSQGQYQFTNLAPGTYNVKFIAPNGASFTTEAVGSNPSLYSDANPLTGITPAFTLTSGEIDTNVNAGLLPIDLTVTKTVSNSAPALNANVTFTIDVSNAAGLSGATDVSVSDLLPAGLTFVSDAPGQGSYNSSTGVWTVGSVASGSSASLTIVAAVVATGTTTNTATVTGADEDDVAAPSQLTSSASVTPVLPVDLAITKTVDNSTPNVGQNVTFTVSLSDLGPGNATGVQVTDSLPAGLTYVSSSPSEGSYNSSTGVWTVGNVTFGAAAQTLTIVATVTTPGAKTNTATITADDQTDTNPNNNQASATVTPLAVDLAITKTVDNSTPSVGQNVTFTLSLSDLGPGNATGVQVTDVLPAGLTYVSSSPSEGSYNSSTGIWTVGTVAFGAPAQTLTVVATVASQGAKTNTATITADDETDTNPNNNQASVTVTPPSADLSLTKTVDNSSPSTGQNVTFTVTVNNLGPSTATNVVTTDVLPSGLTFVSDTASQGSYDASTGLWTIGTMANGGSVILTVVANVATGGSKTNTATVTDDQYDPNLSNNTASVTLAPTGSVGTYVFYDLNQDGVYDQGDLPAANVTVNLLLNGSVVATTTTNAQGVYSFTGLPAGDYTVQVVAPDGANFTTEGVGADASLSSNVDPSTGITTPFVLASGQAVTTEDAGLLPVELGITKTVDNPRPVLGQTVNFTITVDDALGMSDATNVLVNDSLPAGLMFVAASASQGSYNSATGTWTVGTVANGTSASLTISAIVTTLGTITNTAEVTGDDEPDVSDPDSLTSSATVVSGRSGMGRIGFQPN